MRTLVLFVFSLLAIAALSSCAKRDTATTPGNPSGTPGEAPPPTTTGPALVDWSALQGTWTTGCVADDGGKPVTFSLGITGATMRYTKETFSSWDCMGPGKPEDTQTLTFEIQKVSEDPNDYQVMVYDGDPTYYDWVRLYASQVPALEFIASDYSTTGGYAHRYFKR